MDWIGPMDSCGSQASVVLKLLLPEVSLFILNEMLNFGSPLYRIIIIIIMFPSMFPLFISLVIMAKYNKIYFTVIISS